MNDTFKLAKVKQTLIIVHPFCPSHALKKALSSQKCVTQMPQKGHSLFTMHALTCEGLDARALKQPGRAVVIVEFFVSGVEAGVDAAVLLRDLRIVKVCGGGHGGSQRGKRVRGRQAASSGGLGVEGMK